MKTVQFWLKTILLTIIVGCSIMYLSFVGVMEFMTGSPPYNESFRFNIYLVLHITVMVLCVLYWIHKIRSWYKDNKKGF